MWVQNCLLIGNVYSMLKTIYSTFYFFRYQPPGYNEDFWKADLGTDKQTPEKSSQGNSKGSNSKKNEKKRKNDYRKSQYDKQKVKKDSLSEKSVQT